MHSTFYAISRNLKEYTFLVVKNTTLVLFTLPGHDAGTRRRHPRRGADGLGLQHVVQEEPCQDSGRLLNP